MNRSYKVFQIVIALMFCVLAVQLYRMQIIQGSSDDEQASGNRERIITQKASRGIVYDRNGVRLVANNPSYSIAITPADFPDSTTAAGSKERARIFADLARILGTRDVISITPADL